MQTPAALPQPLPPPPQVTIVTQDGSAPVAIRGPMSTRELRALRNRRENLSDQLVSVQNRREEVAKNLLTADPAARQGLQDRLAVLDARIVQLESDIASTGRELTSAAGGLAAVSEGPPFAPGIPSSDSDGPAFFLGFAAGAVAIGLLSLIRRWRRGGHRHSAAAAVLPEQFNRLEQSIDAIAVEVERISEGQRFTARLMADGQERARREALLRDG